MQQNNSSVYPDTIYFGSRIYAGKYLPKDLYFIAIKNNRIFKIGQKKDMNAIIGKNTEMVELNKNHLLMPGFHDSHTHLLIAGMSQTCINLESAKSEEEAAKMVADYSYSVPSNQWIIGFRWHQLFWKNKTLPSARSLDKYIPERPVFLYNSEAHCAWINSKAMELANINRKTKDIPTGEILKDNGGNPIGLLFDNAEGFAAKYAFDLTEEQRIKYIMQYMHSARENGITSVNDMIPFFGVNMGNIETYTCMDKDNKLSARVYMAPDLMGDLDEILRKSKEIESEKFQIPMVKQFIDGVATDYSALLLEPYTDNSKTKGRTLIDLDKLKSAIEEAHMRGISVRLHACGDGSVRAALDAIEAAIGKYGNTGARHAIEHNELIDECDIKRYAKLGVIASMQPEHIAITNDFGSNPFPERLGEKRCEHTWPINSLLKTGAKVVFGSDCPIVDKNPFLEIYRAITRVYNDGLPKGGWNPQEKISVESAIDAYTRVPAYSVKREKEIGTLEEGKIADMIVVNKNLLDATPEEIKNAKVVRTIFDGKEIYNSCS